MSPETPGWVRDAVFYQIFPDRFARSELSDQIAIAYTHVDDAFVRSPGWTQQIVHHGQLK